MFRPIINGDSVVVGQGNAKLEGRLVTGSSTVVAQGGSATTRNTVIGGNSTTIGIQRGTKPELLAGVMQMLSQRPDERS